MRASAPKACAWVSAHAGTGKTHVLIERIARLLLAGADASRILCITFTKSAAAEMAHRLYEKLGFWASASDEALLKDLTALEGTPPNAAMRAEARLLFARVLETPGGVQIQTIHAFCQNLLKRFPLEAQIAPAFRVADERESALLLREAQSQMLARAMSGAQAHRALAEALAHVSALVDKPAFEDLFADITERRLDISRMCPDAETRARKISALAHLFGIEPTDTYDSLRREMVAGFPEAAMRAARDVFAASGMKTDAQKAARLDDVLKAHGAGGTDALDAAWDTYMSVFFTQEGTPRQRMMTKAAQRSPGGAEALSALAAEHKRLTDARQRMHGAFVLHATQALLTLAGDFLHTYEASKRRLGLLDYDDLIIKAGALLSERDAAQWVLYKLDGGLDHVLVDEAQDTTPAQWAVVRALTEEFFAGAGARETRRTIFTVGDPKQSIFSFQGALPEAFDATHDWLAAHVQGAARAWLDVRLDASYRSAPEILRAVDAVFAQTPARAGVVASGASLAHTAIREDTPGRVVLWEPEASPPDETEPAEAWMPCAKNQPSEESAAQLARRIAGTIAQSLATGTTRPREHLVLVRKRGAFVDHMIRALKERGIPVAGADRMRVIDHIAVQDLMALARFVLLPQDDLTLAEVLKGSLCGLDDDELMRFAPRREGTLWEALRAYAKDNPGAAEAEAYLRALLARADFDTPFAFFAQCLNEGGRRKLAALLGPEAHDPIDAFLSLALDYEKRQLPSLQGFLHELETSQIEMTRDMERDADYVRLMTVHGAKGLEARIVFLVDDMGAPGGRPDKLLYLTTKEGAVPVWPVAQMYETNPCLQERTRQSDAQTREYHRLLYVAMTRARDALYVCGYLNKRQNAPREGGFFDLCQKAGLGTAQADMPPPDTGARMPAPEEVALPAWARMRVERPLAPRRAGMDAPPVMDAQAAVRGGLVHAMLAFAPALEEQARADAMARFLARSDDLTSPPERAEMMQAVETILRTPALARFFGPDARAEVPVEGLLDGRRISRRIDRLLVPETGAVEIVEIKTDADPPQNAADIAPAYLRQIAEYHRLVARIFPERDVRAGFLWTQGACFMPVGDAVLNREASPPGFEPGTP